MAGMTGQHAPDVDQAPPPTCRPVRTRGWWLRRLTFLPPAPTSAIDAAPDDAPVDRVEVERVLARIASGQVAATSTGQFVASLIVAGVLFESVPIRLLALWLAILTVLSAWRLVSPIRRRLTEDGAAEAEMLRYQREEAVNGGLSGLIWGLLPVALADPADPEQYVFAVSVVVALTAAGVASNAAARRRGRLFVSGILLPLTVGNAFWFPIRHGQTMAVLCLLLLGMMLLYLRRAAMVLQTMVEGDLRNKRLRAALEEAVRTTEAANRAKSRFLANMSHEIRTPMNAVIGLTHEVLEGPLTPAQRSDIETIQREGGNLLDILNDILDLSKLHAGRMELEAASFCPADLTLQVHGLLRARAEATGIGLRVTVPPGTPAVAIGDAVRVRQILVNLAANAIKFTEQGVVRIALTTRPDDRGLRIEWVIEDTGIGIPPDRLPDLFDEFSQADTSITRRFGGTGLGLAICRRLVDEMGGALTVRSTLGIGSTFRVSLHLPAGTAPPISRTGSRTASRLGTEGGDAKAFGDWLTARGERLRILMAEDNRVNVLVMSRLLDRYPIDLITVGDGARAVEAVRAGHFDLILMDLQMPVMDGLMAARTIRALGGWQAHVPIVALTANAYAEDREACREAGMNGFLAKPVVPGLLREAIREALTAPVEQGGRRFVSTVS